MKFKVDSRQTKDFLSIAPKKTSLVIVRATKRGTMAARTEGARAVAKDMGLPVGVARNAIRMTSPSSKTEAVGILRASLRRIPLINFGARGPEPSRGRGRGVTYKSKGGRKRVESGFITAVGSGHRGVFRRAGERRLPIRELFGPSIGRVFDLMRDRIVARGVEVTEKEIDRGLNRAFGIK